MSTQTICPFDAVSPFVEMGAYEYLWTQAGMTWKRIADLFRDKPGQLPSSFVSESIASRHASEVMDSVRKSEIPYLGIRINQTLDYPKALRDAAHPVELLYFSGCWDLVSTPCIAVVGTRKPTSEGIARTKKLVRALAEDGYTIVSGLAEGIDTVAHETAIEVGAPTIAVIGTPLTNCYPKTNAKLQKRLTEEYLVISQVPFLRWHNQDWRANRAFMPERNITMSALTTGTVIVEAGETSGSLIQGRAALQQDRKLFILDSCFHKGLDWPDRLQGQGGKRIREYDEIRTELQEN